MPFSLATPAHHELIIKKSRFIACVEPMPGREEAQAHVGVFDRRPTTPLSIENFTGPDQ